MTPKLEAAMWVSAARISSRRVRIWWNSATMSSGTVMSAILLSTLADARHLSRRLRSRLLGPVPACESRRAPRPVLARSDAVLSRLVADDSLGRVQQASCLGDVPARALDRIEDQVLFESFHRRGQGCRAGGGARLCRLERRREVMAVDRLSIASEHCVLDGVFQLAHVARPLIRHQHLRSRRRNAPDDLAVLLRMPGEEMMDEEHDVGLSIAQRRHLDGGQREAVMEVFAK